MAMSSGAPSSSASGGFAPLRQPVFAVLWVATVLGNVGTFMRDVASAWLVTDLSASPAAVALIQAAGSLPIFLLAIPAGVLTDILDRRRFLIALQFAMAAVSGSLLLLSHSGTLTLEWLIGLTFAGGVFAALMGPTWQAIVPEIVPRAEVKAAVALNSLGINIARAIGPAAGGLILASFGAAVTYGMDVLSYVVVTAALLWWRRPQHARTELSENFFGAFRAGLRFTRASSELHVVLLRAVVFFVFSSAVWALLPLVARRMLGGSAGFYGVLLGAVGAGAIIGAVLLPRLRERLNADGLVLLAAIAAACVMAGLAFAPPKWLAVGLLVLLGVGWIVALTTFNSVAQAILPNWVRGRGLAVYLMAFNGAMAGGSLVWGALAQAIGIPAALWVGAAGLVLLALMFHRVKLPTGEADLQASNHWPEPLLSAQVENDRGPVMVQVEYRIRARDRHAFLAAMRAVSDERRRDGAYAWGITESTADPEQLMEWFLVESWAEHLRQHQRVSHSDADLQQAAVKFHIGDGPPRVIHFLALEVPPRL
ncbi:MAG: MFS transporter [Caldimonas sp.]